MNYIYFYVEYSILYNPRHSGIIQSKTETENIK